MFSFHSLANEVNVYSSRQEALIKPLLNEFTQQSGIKVNLVTGKADALLTRIKSEGKFTPADLVLLADVGRLVRAKQMGITQSLNKDGAYALVDAQLRDEDGHWIALTKRARPIMYKKGSFDTSSISSILDLAKPEFANSICIRSSNNIYNQSLVSAMIELQGEEATLQWAKGLVSNFARTPKGGDRDQIKAMIAGECKVAIANTYYLGGMLASKDDNERKIAEQVGVLWHDQSADSQLPGVHVNVSGAALTPFSKNKAQAEALLSFMLSAESQKWYAEVNHEYPVIDGVELSPQLSSFGNFNAQNIALEKVGENNAKALLLMDKAGWK
ncbi:extracellular solute-binding protein [Glaciecola sp. 2405UD65-10]|uniref:extracellular solute-binding protein n=1 Tax=Glaciecola sp. 2405UD65-10 TaxID=3397244 RepID=UPI003B5AF032